MKTRLIATAACSLLVISTPHGLAQVSGWHTTPDKWNEPRLFHTPFESALTNRVQVGRSIASVIPTQQILSPNKAYSFMVLRPDTSRPGPWNSVITINNERPGSLQLLLRDHASYDISVKWINEKLLFVRVWWGRVLGTDLILDVEKECVVSMEMVNDGVIPFQQWQQKRIAEPESNDDGLEPAPEVRRWADKRKPEWHDHCTTGARC